MEGIVERKTRRKEKVTIKGSYETVKIDLNNTIYFQYATNIY